MRERIFLSRFSAEKWKFKGDEIKKVKLKFMKDNKLFMNNKATDDEIFWVNGFGKC